MSALSYPLSYLMALSLDEVVTSCAEIHTEIPEQFLPFVK
jgi:hypothetical protein